MIDAQYINLCSHHITDEEIKIVPNSNGTYMATLRFPALMIKGRTFIRSYNDEQNYIASLSANNDYDKYVNYSYKTVNDSEEIPEAGIIKAIGITNYYFENDTTIIFENEPKIDIREGLTPPNKYYIDYYTTQADCPMCNGKNLVRDISYSAKGQLVYCQGHNRLVQRVLKTLLTPRGDSPEDSFFGSGLDGLIGSEAHAMILIVIQKEVYDAVQYLMEIQSSDLPLDEYITGVQSIKVDRSETNPSAFIITVNVKDGYGNIVPCVVTIGVS